MITIQLDDPKPADLAFSQALGVKKGLIDAPTPPESKLSLGGPVSIALSPGAVQNDPELSEFVRQRQDVNRYHLLYLSCTFLPSGNETFEKAWIQVKLGSSGAAPGAQPIAWSMKPDRLFNGLELTHSAKLGSSLKLVDAQAETGEKVTYQLVYLQSLNELQSNPTWHLRSVDGVDIEGCYRFQLVVQSPLAPAFGEIGITAEVRRKRWGVVPYRANLPDMPQIRFDLA